MLLAIDAGNTNIVFTVYDGEVQQFLQRLETGEDVVPVFEKILNVDAVIISSVVPAVNDTLKQQCLNQYGIDPLFVNHHTAGIDVQTDQPEEVGADRLVNAVAVKENYQYPAVIVDFGTATTFDVVDGVGRYAGGVIAPGINLSLEALSMAAAKLPEVTVDKPSAIIGKNTKEAMQSGIYWGYVGLIEGTVRRIAEEMNSKPFVIATGGLAPLFSEGTDIFDATDSNLTMKGLVAIYKAQTEKQSGKAA
jgi:type III pantothenate kinase